MSKTQASKIVGWAMARQTSIHAIIGVFMVLGLCIFAFVAVYAPRAPGDEPLASIVMGTLFAVIFLGVRPFLKALYWYARPQALPLYQLIHERPQDIVRVGETRREVEVHQSAGGGVVAAQNAVSAIELSASGGLTYYLAVPLVHGPRVLAALQVLLPHATFRTETTPAA